MTALAKATDKHPGIAFRMPGDGMTDEEFYQFCMLNPELRIERTYDKFILITPPTNSDTGNRNAELMIDVGIWNRKTILGKLFDSSTGFNLSNGAERSPDLAWIRNDRWAEIPEEQKQRFAPITPDFVAEIRTGDQNMAYLKDKMEEYMACGCRLAWLIDPKSRKTWVYAENGDIQTIPFDTPLNGGEVMPGFEIRLADIFDGK